MKGFKLGILHAGFGNVKSLSRVLSTLGYLHEIVTDCHRIATMSHLIIPGVGSFNQAMMKINKNRMLEEIAKRSLEKDLPTLGICLGAQLLLTRGYEGQITEGIGVIQGEVRNLESLGSQSTNHTGWDQVLFKRDFLDFRKGENIDFYFNHEYYFHALDEIQVIATVASNPMYPVILKRGSTIACQFHPEKSQESGRLLLKNFLKM
jgi:glutamine amidotransferase